MDLLANVIKCNSAIMESLGVSCILIFCRLISTSERPTELREKHQCVFVFLFFSGGESGSGHVEGGGSGSDRWRRVCCEDFNQKPPVLWAPSTAAVSGSAQETRRHWHTARVHSKVFFTTLMFDLKILNCFYLRKL